VKDKLNPKSEVKVAFEFLTLFLHARLRSLEAAESRQLGGAFLIAGLQALIVENFLVFQSLEQSLEQTINFLHKMKNVQSTRTRCDVKACSNEFSMV